MRCKLNKKSRIAINIDFVKSLKTLGVIMLSIGLNRDKLIYLIFLPKLFLEQKIEMILSKNY